MGQTAGEIRYDIERTRDRMSATIDAIGYRLDIPARMRYRFSHIMHDVSGVFTGKPGNGNGGEPGLLAKGEETVSSILQAAQGGAAGVADVVTDAAGAVEDRLSSLGQTVQSGISGIKESVMDTMTTGERQGGTGTYGTGTYGTGSYGMTGGEGMTEQVKSTAQSTWRRVGGFAKDNALALSLGALAVGVIAGMFIPRSKIEQEKITPLADEIKHKAVETGEKVIHKGQQMAEKTMGQSGQSGQGGQGGQGGQQQPVGAGQTSGQHYGMGSDPYRPGQ